MVSMHLSSFALPVVVQIIVTFYHATGLCDKASAVRRVLLQSYKVNRLSNAFKKFCGRLTDLVGLYKKNVFQMFADSISYNDFHFFTDLPWPN